MHKKITLIISALLVAILAIIISINIINTKLNKENLNYYTWTKAICNENSCQDYIIECRGEKFIKQTPITGAVIQKPENWTDLRDENMINKTC